MPLTPADAELVATHLLAKTVPNQFRPDAAGKPTETPFSAFLTYGDHHFDVLSGQISALAASESAAKAELDQVKTTVGSVLTAVQGILSAGNATVAEVETAIQAELSKLGALLGSVK